MKKMLIVLLVILLFVVAGCNSNSPDTIAEDNDNDSTDESINVEKGIFDVTITLPASMVDLENIEETIAEAKEKGVKEVIVNDDGSITYKMTKSAHNDIMQDLHNSFEEMAEELTTSGDFVSIKNIEYKKDFSSITLVVDKSVYENSLDGFAVFGLGIAAMYYQLFDGVQPEKINVLINLKDTNTGEVFGTIIYPDALEELD